MGWRDRAEQLFSLDLRALGLLRIALGAIVLVDVADRLPDFETFYTDLGVLPARYITTAHWASYHLNVLRFFEGSWAVLFCFVALAISATALVLGYRTRLATFATWYFLSLVHHRNNFLLDVGDIYLRLMMVWGFFLPWQARYSLDSLRQSDWKKLPNQFYSLATFGYLIQVSTAYFMAALLKYDPLWTRSGDALYCALSIDQFSTDFAKSLLAYPHFLKIFNFLALGIEYTAPFFLLCPWNTRSVRAFGIFLLLCFHFGILCCLHLGLLVPICMLVLIGLVPGHIIDWFETKLGWKPGLVSVSQGPEVNAPVTLPSNYRLGLPVRAFISTMVFYTVFQNCLNLPGVPLVHGIILPVANYGRLFGLLQNWQLFAPYPFREDGWYVIEGITADGRSMDLEKDGKLPSWDKPLSVAATFKNQRWRRYYQNLWQRANPRHIPYFCMWQMHHWNSAHPDRQVAKVRLIFVQELTELAGVPLNPTPYILGEYPTPGFDPHEGIPSGECTCQEHRAKTPLAEPSVNAK